VSKLTKRAVAALVLATLLAAGCGGGGGNEMVAFKKGGPPAPKQCIERWNGDRTALELGKHAYSPGHDSRAGRVFFVDEPRRELTEACVAVFAASESDLEYGTLGGFNAATRNLNSGQLERRWRQLTFYPARSPDQRVELQRSGAERANVALEESGRITSLD
jgi:hypothetical protein